MLNERVYSVKDKVPCGCLNQCNVYVKNDCKFQLRTGIG